MEYTVMQDFVYQHLSVLIIVISLLSMVGCLLIMFTYWAYKDTRIISRHIVVCLSIADFFTAFGSFFAAIYGRPGARDTGCVIQSFITSTSVMSSLLWTIVLSVYLYCYVVKENADRIERLMFPAIHMVCWLVPLSINLVALFLGKLGGNDDLVSSGYCWIKFNLNETISSRHEQHIAVIWMFLDAKALEIVTYVIIFYIYLRIKCFINRKVYLPKAVNEMELMETNVIAARSFGHKLALIPSILVLLRMWGTIRFFILLSVSFQSTSYGRTLTYVDKGLLVLQAIGDNMIGAANCILFCFCSPKIMSHWKSSIKKNVKTFPRSLRSCRSGVKEVPLNERTHLFAASIS